MKHILSVCAGILMVSAAPIAMAQTAPAATPAITPPTFGAPIPGVCVLNEEQAMASSQLGQAAADRLRQLGATVQAELDPEAETLETEYQALVSSESTTPAAQRPQWEQRAAAWEQKRAAFERKSQIRNQELQVTRQQVMTTIMETMIPFINASVTAKSCAVVLSASTLFHYDVTAQAEGRQVQNTVTYTNSAMDITSDVVQRMNASGTRLPQFNRVNLEQRAAGAQP